MYLHCPKDRNSSFPINSKQAVLEAIMLAHSTTRSLQTTSQSIINLSISP